AEKTFPRSYSLYQNYPNPFNPSTVIRFDLPEVQDVSLKVFNLLGQEVANLVNGVREAGEHSVTADFTNLSSGMYFYRLSAGQFNAVKKLLVIK
ncbi:MAG: T9SS type A sorting domain-containing protein, partial [bacterium]